MVVKQSFQGQRWGGRIHNQGSPAWYSSPRQGATDLNWFRSIDSPCEASSATKPDMSWLLLLSRKLHLRWKKWQRILKRKIERKEEQGRWWGLGCQSRHQPCWLAWKNALKQLIAFVGKEDNFCPKVKKQEKGARHVEDQSDEVHRKSLVGLFSSPARLTTIWRAW